MSTRYRPGVALLVVDVQNDFTDPDGSLAIDGGPDILPVLTAEIDAAQAGGAPVLYTQDWHPPRTPHFVTDGGSWPVHCVAETWGAALHPDLQVVGEIVRKGVDGGDGYSGFSVRDPVSGEESATALGRLLDDAGVRDVVVTGLALDVCVKATALDAQRLGYAVTVPRATTRSVEMAAGDGERALNELTDAGVEVTAT